MKIRHKNKSGYIAISLVSSVMLITLLTTIDLSQWLVFNTRHVDDYYDMRELQTLVYSCISIVQIKILSEQTSLQNYSTKNRTGSCSVEMLQEDAAHFDFRVVARRRDLTLPVSITLNKSTGEIVDFVVL